MSNKFSRMVKENSISLLWTAGSILGFLLMWQSMVSFTKIGKVMPGPFSVLVLFFESFIVPIGTHNIQTHAMFSLKRVMVGYSVATLSGITFGVLLGVSKPFRAVFRPIFELIRPIPTVAWIPLAILWFGADELSKYFIVFYGAFANVVLNVYAGVLSVDPVLLGAAKMLGASDKQLLVKVILPSCIPNIFAGMQVALSAGICSVIVAEMIKSNEGVGWTIIMGQETANTTQILAGMVSLAIFGLLLAAILRFAERKLCSWYIRNT